MLVLEREHELAVVGRALREASAGAGGVIVLAGPLGNGKTALLHALRRHPEAAGCTVLTASASAAEREFAHGVVRQLFDPVLVGAPEAVWRGRAASARAVLAPARGAHAENDGHELSSGLCALAANLAEEQPLLVLVDDLQWADAGSLEVLAQLARRSTHLRVLLVVTVREGHPLAEQPTVVSIIGAAVERLWPAPLSFAGVTEVVHDRLGQECDAEFALACHEATLGNPLRVTALVSAWAMSGRAPVAAAAEEVRTMRTTRVRDRLVACMRGLSGPARALLMAMAVLVDAEEPRMAGELAELDEGVAAQARRSLRRLGLLTGDEFAHLGVRDAAEELITPAERESLQLRAVRLLYDNGRPAEHVADQLMQITVPQGPWAVHVLRVAAEAELRRGNPRTAARYLRRALLDTSVDGQDRAKVLVDLVAAEHRFDRQAAIRSTSYAVSLLPEAGERAAVIIQLAPAVVADAPLPVVSLLREVAKALGDPARLDGTNRELALRVEARLWQAGQMNALELDAALMRFAELEPDVPTKTSADRELLAVLLHGATLTARRPSAQVAALAEEVLVREPAGAPHIAGVAPLLVTSLAAADAPGRAAKWLGDASTADGQCGDAAHQATISTEQSLVHLLSGRFQDAAAAARGAFDLGVWDWRTVGSSTSAMAGVVALQLRDRMLIEHVLATVSAQPEPPTGCLAAIVGMLRGSAAAWRGDLRSAVVALTECGHVLDRSGWRNPVLFPWRTTLAQMRHRLGHTDEAIALAEEERLIAQEWGAPSAIGRTWRVLGSLSSGDHAAELTSRAVEVLEGSEHRLELTLSLRQWAGQSGRVDVWRRCLDAAVEIGSGKIAEQARAALGGGAPVSVARLTPSEQRVALLAAAGSSNQEIAESLAVTSRAVEKHLTNTYRKLGVRGRADLAEALHQLMPNG